MAPQAHKGDFFSVTAGAGVESQPNDTGWPQLYDWENNHCNEFIPADGHADTQLLHNNEAIIAIENNEAARGQQLNFTLTLTPVLNEKQFRNVSDNTEMESNLSWELLTH